MRKFLIGLLILLTASFSFAGDKFLIDDFSSKSLKSPREYWCFDCRPDVSQRMLVFKSQANNWYAGGVGTYIAKPHQDLSEYNALQVDITGNGDGNGNLKIELYCDDAHDWTVKQDPKKNFEPLKNTRWTYEERINWMGLQTITIPLLDFENSNPGIGSDKMDIGQKNGTAGLLQIQFICLGNKADGEIDFSINSISLVKTNEK